MKNGYRITDAHAHVFPDKIAEKATEGISHFYDLPMQYHGRVAEMLENGTAAGIDHFLVCSPATTVCTAFGTLHPYAENVEADFQQLRSLQLRGVKLHPDFQNFPIDDPRAYPMYEMIQSSGLPILMHMGDAKSDFSHTYRLAMILRQFPKLRIIAAHFGGWGQWKEATAILQPDERLRFDTSSSLPFLPPEEIRKLLSHFGAENCFFGVDYPMWDYRKELERFFALELSDSENRAILSENLEVFLDESYS